MQKGCKPEPSTLTAARKSKKDTEELKTAKQ